jgi:hypothetical protein
LGNAAAAKAGCAIVNHDATVFGKESGNRRRITRVSGSRVGIGQKASFRDKDRHGHSFFAKSFAIT